MNNGLITSDVFRISPVTYLRITAGDILPRLLWFIVIPILGLLIWSLWDVRMLLVALILMFLVIPFAVFHVYFSRLHTSDAQSAISPKRVSILPNQHINIVYNSIEEEKVPLQSEFIEWSLIENIDVTSKWIVIYINGHKQPLIIPISSLPSNCNPYKIMWES